MKKNLIEAILIIVLILVISSSIFSQDMIETNVGSTVENKEVESVDYFKLAVSPNIEEALFYDTFTTSEYIKYNKKAYPIDIVYIVGYATSQISLDIAKDLAVKSVFFANKIENIASEDIVKENLQTKKFYFYKKDKSIVFGCLSFAKLTEYNTTPMKYIEKSKISKIFYIIKKGIKKLLGFGRLIEAINNLGLG